MATADEVLREKKSAKDLASGGDIQAPVIVQLAALALIAPVGLAAAACPPAVRLIGDPALVTEVAKMLAARGIALGGECPLITARVEQRDGAIAIAIESNQAIERTVREVATAATVIESFARDDAAPLLAVRVPQPAKPAAPVVVAEAPARGLRVFAGLEGAVGSDRSAWLGFHGGGCWMLEVVCLAGRVRRSNRADDDGMQPFRDSWEVLLGIDIPFALRSWQLAPGIALGPSGMRTRGEMDGYSTNGIRAEAHVTLSVPVTAQFAVDVHVAGNLLQSVHFDERSQGSLPAEPWGFARLGVGLRYAR